MIKKVLFIDSGIGGLSTLAHCLKLCPTLNYTYVADNLNAPYGNKTPKQIIGFLTKIIDAELKINSIGIIVLACNTATATAASFLRTKYPKIKIIGTEPAILPALKETNLNEKVLVFATPTTCRQTKFKKLINPYKNSLIVSPLNNLAQLIEKQFSYPNIATINNIKAVLFKYCAEYGTNVSCVVLGCTHYSLITPIFKEIFKVPIIDGNMGVAKMLFKTVSGSKNCYFCPTKVFPSIKPTAPTKTNYHKILTSLLK